MCSIRVFVKVYATFKEITKTRNVDLEFDKEIKILHVLNRLVENYPQFQAEFFDENENLREWVKILKNGRNIAFLEGLNTKIISGDEIAIFPPAAGG